MFTFGMWLGDQTISVNGSLPKPVRGVPNETVVRDWIREASVWVFLMAEGIVRDLVIERSFGEMRPGNERWMVDVGGSPCFEIQISSGPSARR